MAMSVTVERPEPGVARVVLDRPERLNAMNYAVVRGLYDAFDERAATWDDDPAKVERACRVADAIEHSPVEVARALRAADLHPQQ